eukprot:c6804_g1_i1.p1 GENE.c6804_g1_i1~~c6804_g1_i1.p1  ORF type:complete len:118 (-),score=11.84 c6804_g1_i1:37-390(-)
MHVSVQWICVRIVCSCFMSAVCVVHRLCAKTLFSTTNKKTHFSFLQQFKSRDRVFVSRHGNYSRMNDFATANRFTKPSLALKIDSLTLRVEKCVPDIVDLHNEIILIKNFSITFTCH